MARRSAIVESWPHCDSVWCSSLPPRSSLLAAAAALHDQDRRRSGHSGDVHVRARGRGRARVSMRRALLDLHERNGHARPRVQGVRVRHGLHDGAAHHGVRSIHAVGRREQVIARASRRLRGLVVGAVHAVRREPDGEDRRWKHHGDDRARVVRPLHESALHDDDSLTVHPCSRITA